MFCFHKYGTVQPDGYQYCTKCGKAVIVGCSHKWYEIKSINVFTVNSKPEYQIIVSRCRKCGEIKQDRIGE